MRSPSWRPSTFTTPLLLSGTTLLAACGVDVPGAKGEGVPPTAERLALVTMAAPPRAAREPAGARPTLTFDGEDFTLRYPADAKVRPLDSAAAPGASTAIEIRGPELRDDEGEPIEGSASYSFEVVTYTNADRLPLEAWVTRQRVRESAQDPVYAVTSVRTDPWRPTSASVGGVPALRESRFGGDCELVRYYVARGDRIIALRYADYPVESDSLNPQNLRTYARVLSTFRWKAGPPGA